MRSACGTPWHDGVPFSISGFNTRFSKCASQKSQPLLHSATPRVLLREGRPRSTVSVHPSSESGGSAFSFRPAVSFLSLVGGEIEIEKYKVFFKPLRKIKAHGRMAGENYFSNRLI